MATVLSVRKGYYTHITFNDNAIVKYLELLRDIDEDKQMYGSISDPG